MPRKAKPAEAGIEVGHHVQYKNVDGALVQSTVAGVLRGESALVIGFYPADAAVGPGVAVTVDRIVKAWPPEPSD